MASEPGGAGVGRAAGDVWKRTLSQIPTEFGRLAYLASLRNPNTGRYEHFGLARVYSDEESDEALRRSHTEALARWLGWGLAQQRRDLEEYLETLEGGREAALDAWRSLGSHRHLLPTDASEAQRELFVQDLELILDLLRHELSPAGRNPAA